MRNILMWSKDQNSACIAVTELQRDGGSVEACRIEPFSNDGNQMTIITTDCGIQFECRICKKSLCGGCTQVGFFLSVLPDERIMAFCQECYGAEVWQMIFKKHNEHMWPFSQLGHKMQYKILESHKENNIVMIDKIELHGVSLSELTTITKQKTTDRDKFDKLANHWKKSTGMLSNYHAIVKDESCQAIINMGKQIFPWIFEDLRDNNASGWVFVLRHIFGDKGPNVPKEDHGMMHKNKQLWLQWGITNEYINHAIQTFRCYYCDFINHDDEEFRAHVKECFKDKYIQNE